jgi:hypothetical protein
MRITDTEEEDDLRVQALAALEGARAARSDAAGSEVAILRALQLAPHDLDVRTGAYKFYFYNGRLDEAAPHAGFVMAQAARRLNISTDWRLVQPDDAAFGSLDAAPRLFVQALVAWGYCMARLRRLEEGRAALAKATELDPSDDFGARVLLAIISRDPSDDDE